MSASTHDSGDDMKTDDFEEGDTVSIDGDDQAGVKGTPPYKAVGQHGGFPRNHQGRIPPSNPFAQTRSAPCTSRGGPDICASQGNIPFATQNSESYSGRPMTSQGCDMNMRHPRFTTKRSEQQPYSGRGRDYDSIPEFVPTRHFHNYPSQTGSSGHSSRNTSEGSHRAESNSEYVNHSSSTQQRRNRDAQSECHFAMPPINGWTTQGHPNAPPVLIGPSYIVLFNAPPNQIPANLPPNLHFVGHAKPPLQQLDPNFGLFNYGSSNIAIEHEYTAIYDPSFGIPSFVAAQVAGQTPQTLTPTVHLGNSELPPMGVTYYTHAPPSFIQQPVPDVAWTSVDDISLQGKSQSESDGMSNGSTTTTASVSSVKLNPNAPEYIPKGHTSQNGTQRGNASLLDNSWSDQMDNHDHHERESSPSRISEPLRSSTPIFSTNSYVNPTHENQSRFRRGHDAYHFPRGRGGYIPRGRSWNNYDFDDRCHYDEQDYGGSAFGYRGRGGRGRGSRGRGRGLRGRSSFYREEYYDNEAYHNKNHETDRGHVTPQSRISADSSSGQSAPLPGPISYASALSAGLTPLTQLPKLPVSKSSAFKMSENAQENVTDDAGFNLTATTFINSAFRNYGGRPQHPGPSQQEHGVQLWMNRNLVEIKTGDNQDFPTLDSAQAQSSMEGNKLRQKGKAHESEGTRNYMESGESEIKDETEVGRVEAQPLGNYSLSADANKNDPWAKRNEIDAGDGVGIGSLASTDSQTPANGAKGEPAQF